MTLSARDLFEAGRESRGPSAEARARVRSKLVRRLGSSLVVAAASAGAATPAAAGGAFFTSAIGKAVVLCAVGGTLLGAGYAATYRRPVEVHPPVTAIAAERAIPAVAPPPAPVTPSEPSMPAAPVAASPAPAVPAIAAPAPSVGRRAPVLAAPVRGTVPAPTREESTAAEPAVVQENAVPAALPASTASAGARTASAGMDALQGELALVRAAHDALRAGRPDVALERMDQHRRDYPNGALAEERDALRVSAICALGRPDGRSEAQAFLANHPESPFVARIRDACAAH
jgi:outer membrane biosynthesis protein TonB